MIFQDVWKRIRGNTRQLTLRDPDGWSSVLGFGQTAAGVAVTADSALQHPAVLGAVRMLAELTASLPLLVYERTAQGRRRADDHPVSRLLHVRPNPVSTPFAFKEAVVTNLLLHGNAYVLLQLPAALWPLDSGRVSMQVAQDGTITYRVATAKGNVGYSADQILHIPLLTMDGITGRSPVQLARESVGAALAAEEHAAAYFANAARPSGVLKTNGVLSPEAAKRLQESWQKAYSRGKAGTAVLEDGVTFEPISANAEDSQLLESRQFAMRTIAAALRIPPHLLDPTARGTYANVETQSLEFLTFSLQPLLTRIEEALTLRLFTPAEQKRYYCEFLTDGLLRADTQTRYNAYAQAIQAGWMTVNEVRQRENLPPLPANSRARLVEIRAAQRRTVAAKHRPALEAAARRVIEKERADVLALVQKALGQRDGQLEAQLSEYYRDLGWIETAMTPALQALIGEAHEDAAAEIKAQRWTEEELAAFVAGVVAAYAAKHAGISQTTISAAMRSEKPAEAVQTALDDMAATRPAKIARLVSVDVANGAALETYKKAGVTHLQWLAGPGSCEACRSLNGKVVGIEQPFVNAGELSWHGMDTGTRVKPPLHDGCDCMIVPVQLVEVPQVIE